MLIIYLDIDSIKFSFLSISKEVILSSCKSKIFSGFSFEDHNFIVPSKCPEIMKLSSLAIAKLWQDEMQLYFFIISQFV